MSRHPTHFARNYRRFTPADTDTSRSTARTYASPELEFGLTRTSPTSAPDAEGPALGYSPESLSTAYQPTPDAPRFTQTLSANRKSETDNIMMVARGRMGRIKRHKLAIEWRIQWAISSDEHWSRRTLRSDERDWGSLRAGLENCFSLRRGHEFASSTTRSVHVRIPGVLRISFHPGHYLLTYHASIQSSKIDLNQSPYANHMTFGYPSIDSSWMLRSSFKHRTTAPETTAYKSCSVGIAFNSDVVLSEHYPCSNHTPKCICRSGCKLGREKEKLWPEPADTTGDNTCGIRWRHAYVGGATLLPCIAGALVRNFCLLLMFGSFVAGFPPPRKFTDLGRDAFMPDSTGSRSTARKRFTSGRTNVPSQVPTVSHQRQGQSDMALLQQSLQTLDGTPGVPSKKWGAGVSITLDATAAWQAGHALKILDGHNGTVKMQWPLRVRPCLTGGGGGGGLPVRSQMFHRTSGLAGGKDIKKTVHPLRSLINDSDIKKLKK
ncbi:hypothetical protein K438DRAFT_1752777 [Mycena galopus ATCC 62051]|nr:hypothetical protein K438DRAFT_1752777 [Mycena galopus ATCC 62051]